MCSARAVVESHLIVTGARPIAPCRIVTCISRLIRRAHDGVLSTKCVGALAPPLTRGTTSISLRPIIIEGFSTQRRNDGDSPHFSSEVLQDMAQGRIPTRS